jgi:hypothetical protein
MAKAKAFEAEAKLMAEERDIMLRRRRLRWRSVMPSSYNAIRDRA